MRTDRLGIAMAIALATALTSTAAAGPIVSDAIDVDGDGAPDDVTMDDDGRLAVAPADGSGAVVVASSGAPGRVLAGRVEVAKVEGRRLVLARAQARDTDGGDAGWGAIFEWRGRELVPLWNGGVGPQGRDAEWSVVVDATSGALVRWEERPDVTACDGAPARLFLKRFDFSAGRFRPVSIAPQPASGAATLVAKRGAAPPGLGATTPPAVFRFEAATTHAGDGGSAEDLAAPRELDDGDATTAWSEDLGGFGRGEKLIARGAVGTQGFRVRALRVIPGDASSAASFLQDNRLKRLVVTAGNRGFVVSFATDPAADPGAIGDPYWIAFDEPIAASCVSVAIDEVYPGKGAKPPRQSGRTAIAELVVLTDLEAGGAEALAELAREVGRGGPGAAGAEHHLARQANAGARALIDVASTASDEERRRARLALARIGDPIGAEQVAAGLRVEANDDDADRLAAGLERMGDGAVPALVALLLAPDARDGARARAAAALGRSSTAEARAALDAVLGVAPRAVRTAAIRALAARAPDELEPLLDALGAAGIAVAREADLWRVASFAIARDDAASPARVELARRARARFAEARDYELRYRLAQVLGSVDPAIEGGGGEVARLFSSETEPAIRLVLVETIARRVRAVDTRESRALAFGIARIGVGDDDPGVRGAATAMLAGLDANEPRSSWSRSIDDALIERLSLDAWTHVRRAAAEGLAKRCARARAADALYAATGSDDADEVREAALDGLVACREPRVGKRLIELARDRNLSARFRERAASLFGPLGDRALVPEVIQLYRDARASSIGDEDNMRVAAAAALALGVLGDPRAAAALLAGAEDPTFPSIQAAAVTALGDLCPAGAARLLRDLARTDDALISRAARSAAKKCAATTAD